jgi:hypothetical protein
MRLLALTTLFWLFFVNAAFGDIIFPGDEGRPRQRRPWVEDLPPAPAPAPAPAPEEPWHPNVEEDAPDSDEGVGFAVVSGLALVGLAAFALSLDHRPRRRRPRLGV